MSPAADRVLSSLAAAVRFISASPVTEGESVFDVQSKQLLTGILALGIFIALLLGLIEWFAEAKIAALLDMAFCAGLLAIYLYLRMTGLHATWVLYAGATGVMVMAPAVTMALGGFVDSGARVMWAFLGPLALVVFRPHNTAWIAFTVCLLTMTSVILIDDAFSTFAATRLTTEVLTVINVVGLLTYLFILLSIYVARLRREQLRTTELLGELQAANLQMSLNVEAAADYVRSLIPQSDHRALEFDWRYVPATSLGGDTLGFHEIDADHVAAYIIDVTGHGLDAALLSVSIINILRSGSIPNTDLRDPGAVLAALNERFQGGDQDHKLFTIWYGVFDMRMRELEWAGGGHPDALLFEEGNDAPVFLPSTGSMLGVLPRQRYPTLRRELNGSELIYLFSDGAYEFKRPDGSRWSISELTEFLQSNRSAETPVMDKLLDYAREQHGSQHLGDDFTMLEIKYHSP